MMTRLQTWAPTTLSFWLAVIGACLTTAPSRPLRRLGRWSLVAVSVGGVGAVYGHVAGVNGLPVEPVPVLPHFDRPAWRSVVTHAVWIIPAGLSAWRDRP